jgi:hypothetical protein
MNPGLIKTFTAMTAIPPYRLVALGEFDGEVVLATAPDDALIGVTQQVGTTAGSQLVDVCMGDLPEIEYGANVARGAALTTDTQGRAVTAAPGAGVEVRTIGYALASGGEGVIVGFQFAPGTLKVSVA